MKIKKGDRVVIQEIPKEDAWSESRPERFIGKSATVTGVYTGVMSAEGWEDYYCCDLEIDGDSWGERSFFKVKLTHERKDPATS